MYKCLPCTTQSCKCTLQKCVSINSVSHCFHKNVKYIYNFLCHIPALQISERSTCLGLHSWQIAALGFRGWQLAFISAHGPPYPAHYASQPHLCTSDVLFSCEERKGEKGRWAGLYPTLTVRADLLCPSTFSFLAYSAEKFRKIDTICSNLHVRKLRPREVRLPTLRKSTSELQSSCAFHYTPKIS